MMTMAIPASWQSLLDTGKYETYTNPAGGTEIRLKQAYQTPTTPITSTTGTTGANIGTAPATPTVQPASQLPASWQTLINTGQYETYTNASGGTEIRLKQQTPTVAPATTTPATTTPATADLTQYQNDYQSEINKRKAINPNDPTISQLTALRDTKIANLYGENYQAEIDKRKAANPNDPMIADLERLRAVKIQGLSDEELAKLGIDRNGNKVVKQKVAGTTGAGDTKLDSNGNPVFEPPDPTLPPTEYDAKEKEYLAKYEQWASQDWAAPYAAQLETKINEILSRTFNYDPATDTQLQLATKNMTRTVLEAMNSRGILNSTITENQVQQGVADLMPQYQQIARQQFQDEGTVLMSQVDMLMNANNTAYNQYMDEGERYAKALELVMSLSKESYTKWVDAEKLKYDKYIDSWNAEIKGIELQDAKIAAAWDRTSELGYVDNAASIILGVPAGTLSAAAREAKIKREQELEDQKTEWEQTKKEMELQYQYSVKLANAKESSSSSTTDTSKMGTSEQVTNYNQLYDIYMGGGSGTYKDNAYGAYQWLTTHKSQNVALVGEKLYNQLLADVSDAMKVQKSYSGETTTQQQFSQQNTVYTKAAAMKAKVVAGTYDLQGNEIPEHPQYTDEEIVSYIVNSGLDIETQVPDVLSQVFTEDELRALGLWQD
jgi:hypothetical protein